MLAFYDDLIDESNINNSGHVLENDIVRSNTLSTNRHTYIASHGDPPFRCHSAHSVSKFRENKEKKGYSSK